MKGGQHVRFVGHGRIPHGTIGVLVERRPKYVPFLPCIDADRQGITAHCRFKIHGQDVFLPLRKDDLVVVEKPKSVGGRGTSSITATDDLVCLMDQLLGF